MKRNSCLLGLSLALLCVVNTTTHAQTLIYDGLSDQTTFTTTTSVTHTFTGQAFNLSAAAGTTPLVSSMRIGRFVVGAQSFAASRVRIQFWGSFDSTATGATQVFSAPIGSPIVFNTGAISTTGNSVTIFTLSFSTPISFPGITNLGIGVNWLDSTDGVTFNDDTNLVTAMRAPGVSAIPIGTNITSGGNVFFRNASNLTTFNFQANDGRVFTGSTQATDGLAMSITAIAVPEPATIAMVGVGLCGAVGYWVRRRRMNNKAMAMPLRTQSR